MATSRHPVIKWIGIALGGVVVLIVAVFLAWDWNWFKPMVERASSAAMGREVTVEKLDASLWDMTLTASGIVIGNPEGFAADSRFGTIDSISLTLDPKSIFTDRFHIPALIIDHPVGDLGRNKAGRANWALGSGEPKKDNAVEKSKPPPLLGSVIVNDGHIHIVDPKLKSDFRIDIDTEEPEGGGEPQLVLDAKGTYTGQPISAHFRGGSLLSLRNPDKPYPVDLAARNGATEVTVKGTIQDPSSFGGANIDVRLKGDNMAQLSDLIAVPLAPTGPYSLKGKLDYTKGRIHFDDFAGKVGNSDLKGNFRVDPGKDRPMITADLTSENVDLADLSGFIGGEPEKAQAERASFFPNKPINFDAVRNYDFDVKYRANKIRGNVPLDDLTARLVIKDGKVELKPFNFGVGQGKIESGVGLDAAKNPPPASANVDFRQVDLRRIMASTKIFEGAGLVGGHAALSGRGASLADIMSTSSGEVTLFMSGGDMSALLVDLAGLDLGNSLLSYLGLPQKTVLRCMVSDLVVDKGVLNSHLFLIDTDAANIVLRGSANLDKETLDLRLETEPKKASVGSLHAPINIGGTFKNPEIRPDAAALGSRGAAAAVLGTLLTPLGALIPTIQLGLGKNSDCNGLIQAVQDIGKNTGAGERGSGSGGRATGGQPQPPAPQAPKAPESGAAPK
jgi:hypothetical protein